MYQVIKSFEDLSIKIQEVICHYCENEKKLSQTARIPETQEAFLDKVNADINSFTDEPVVQCDVEVAEYSLLDDFK